MMLALAIATTVRIGVFGLFHPVELEVQPARASLLVVESEGRKQRIEGSSSVRLRSAARVTGVDGAEASFWLSVPGKIRREFRGRIEILSNGNQLQPIVEMDRETAVASVVAAEMPRAPVEAQKAQAAVARSFLIAARGRHDGFDFCDTTHCQFLREPPLQENPAHRAQEETRGLVLTYQGRVLAALYSADCGGRTQTLEDAGWRAEEYPYFAIECSVRRPVSGHRLGMCQAGAADMARHGKTFREILSHYFPATSIASLEHPR
jgi:peptidoglycan hydrolase-like amidase